MSLTPHKAALLAGEKYYVTGKPCKRGHFERRFVNGGRCMECTRIAARTWRNNNLEYARANSRNWMAKNKDRVRRNDWKRYNMPEPTRPEPTNCELCNRTQKNHLHLDHDHQDGHFRGWLCNKCNLGLGALGDTLTTLRRAVAYLEKSE